MIDERLSRHLQHENAALKSENSRLKMDAQAHDSAMQEKNNEILRLLNQIATDMIRKDDVDRLIAEAVEKATAALETDYKNRMEAMAAEYEAKIAVLRAEKRSGKDDDKDDDSGRSAKNPRKKSGTVICNTIEEAMELIHDEVVKAAVMQDQAFGDGSEKLSSEQKPA